MRCFLSLILVLQVAHIYAAIQRTSGQDADGTGDLAAPRGAGGDHRHHPLHRLPLTSQPARARLASPDVASCSVVAASVSYCRLVFCLQLCSVCDLDPLLSY